MEKLQTYITVWYFTNPTFFCTPVPYSESSYTKSETC